MTEYLIGSTPGKFSLPGFNGEGEVDAVKLLIDGIPSKSNDGNMPYLDMLMPLDIEAIEVVRGTNDPRYGLHNIAGNANVVTKIGAVSSLSEHYSVYGNWEHSLQVGISAAAYKTNPLAPDLKPSINGG